MLTLTLLLLGCSGDDGRKHWLLWEDVALPGPAGELGVWPFRFCGPDHFLYGDQLYQLSTGEPIDGMGLTPRHPVTGEAGVVTCTEEALFTAPPQGTEGWISEGFGPWEPLASDDEGLFVNSVMADSQGTVWRTLYAANASGPPALQRSLDQGQSWERMEWIPTNPAGGAADFATLVGVEVYLELSVQDSQRHGGLVRLDLEGDRSLLSVGSFDSTHETPSPFYSYDGAALVGYVLSLSGELPNYHFGQLYFTDKDPFDRSTYDYDPILGLGHVLPDRSAPVALEDAVAQHPDGHLYLGLEDGVVRTTLPWTESARSDALLGRGCDALEWTSERYDAGGDGDGPGEVIFTHSGGDPMLVGALERQRTSWQNPQELGDDNRWRYDYVDPGETFTVTSERAPLLVVDDLGRCRRVLRTGDGGEVDLGDY